MFNSGNGVSLADIAAVTGRNNGNGGWGDGGGWWAIIILFALFGFGGDGFFGNRGNNGNNNRGNCCNGGETVVVPYPTYGMGGFGGGWGAYDAAAMQRGFDNQAVISKLDGITNGICNLGYDQLAQMNGINQTVQQTGFNIIQNQTQGNFGLQQQIQQNAIASMQGFNDVARAQERCCCENREQIAQERFDMSNYNCQTNTNIHQTGDAIIQNQNQGFQMLNNTIRDGFTALSMEQKDLRIAELERKLNAADRDSALAAMGNYVVSQVSPRTQPAYLTCNPNTGNVFPQAGIDQWRYANQGGCCQNSCCDRCC